MTVTRKFATAYVVESGGVAGWTDAAKALADDDQNARVYLPRETYSPGVSAFLRLYGYDFSAEVPVGFTITDVAIEVELYGQSYGSSTGGGAAIQWWNGTTWQSVNLNDVQWFWIDKGFVGSPPSSYSIGAVSADVLASWATTGAVRIRCSQSTNTALAYLLDKVSISVTYTAPAAPTVTAIAAASGSAAGGELITITGTGFQTSDGQDLVSGVTVGGIACTEVAVASPTSLSCRVGAHAAGAVDVVVTNAGGSGTLTNGYTYLTTVDSVVKVVKGGVVSGSNLASAALWPSSPAEQVYGGPTELWDSLTVANVNASTFGFVISATVGTGAEGRIDYAAARFHYTVTGLGDPASYLAVLRVASDRQTARPELYQLPRSGFAVANDPSIDRRVSAGAEFRTVRRFAPGRNVEKIWHSRELWLDESVQGNTPGLQVFAKVDDGPEFQLRDGGGTAVTLRGTGPKEVFFPKGDQARGRYMQLIYRVPALGTGQVAAAYAVREGATHLLCRPKKTWSESFTLVLGAGEFEDRTSQRASGREQLERLIALSEPGRPAIAVREPNGRTGYCSVTGLEWREAVTKDGPVADTLLANITLRMARYE